MQAIVEGRGAEVLRDDARVGLDRIAQVNRLVERFFDVGEIQDAVPDRLDLRKLLEKVARGAKAWFGKLHHADIRLELSLPEGAATSGDRDLLEMALVNLLKNAAEAIAHGDYPRLIEIAGDAVAGAARIRIRDFGPGLPIDRLADPFSPGLSHKRNGSGLGLSIARDFIESMGGRIRLASSTHEGTCFEILLNLVP
jgi:signal transduction histidine kinase